MYGSLVEEADQLEPTHQVMRQIELDINRTFPKHPYFNKDKQGEVGVDALNRVLRAFAVKTMKEENNVGYT
jgi:hypothetical protein